MIGGGFERKGDIFCTGQTRLPFFGVRSETHEPLKVQLDDSVCFFARLSMLEKRTTYRIESCEHKSSCPSDNHVTTLHVTTNTSTVSTLSRPFPTTKSSKGPFGAVHL